MGGSECLEVGADEIVGGGIVMHGGVVARCEASGLVGISCTVHACM